MPTAATTSEPIVETPPRRHAKWRRTAAAWIAALAAYWLVLFVSTHTSQVEAVGPVLEYDKAMHAGAYAVLATLLMIAWRRTGASPTWRGRLAVAALVLAYGALDEITQPFSGRTCSLYDWLADLAGVAVALGVDQWRHPRRS